MSLFPYCCPILGHLCHKILFPAIDCFSYLLFFQFSVTFSPLMAYIRNILPIKGHFICLKCNPRPWIEFSWHDRPIVGLGFDFQLFYGTSTSELQKTAPYYLQIETCVIVKIIWVSDKTPRKRQKYNFSSRFKVGFDWKL